MLREHKVLQIKVHQKEVNKMNTSNMTQDELDLWSDINNPNNEADMDDWAHAHNPNNEDYFGDDE
ncbi:hypothetical protein [Aliarcobacter butzleri]|uniref:hypothetical protein n=1 Tax=Aliarcobacter butzleri TaxID=28197 RepID=UPI001EDA137A|nr:hypothetical protein [Aliarcobacter butzleri]